MNVILCSERDRQGDYFVFHNQDERYLHIIKVLKLKTNDTFKAGLINAELGIACIKDLNSERIVFDFVPTIKPHPLHPLHLLLGIPRPIQLKRLLKDISTLGISSINLTGTVLGEKSYITSSLIARDEIEKYLIEGAAQAGSTLLPSYRISSSLARAFEQNDILRGKAEKTSNVIRLLFDVEEGQDKASSQYQSTLDAFVEDRCSEEYKENEPLPKSTKNKSLLSYDSAKGKQIVLAIGSERGWVRSEREMFRSFNFNTITLGSRIMRCETATIAAISYILTKIGWDA